MVVGGVESFEQLEGVLGGFFTLEGFSQFCGRPAWIRWQYFVLLLLL